MLRILCAFALLSLGLLCLSQPEVAEAQVTAAPSLLNFQGRLTKPDGTPVADGTYAVRFSLHDALTGGAEKWNQTLSTLTVRNGTFAALLSGFPSGTFNGNLWMEIKIGTDAPLTPRQQLVSVAYAMKANTVPDGSITADKLASDALNTLSWLLSGNSGTNPASNFLGTKDSQPLVFRTNNTEKMRLLADGNLGIGTTTPGTKLDVVGGSARILSGPLTSTLLISPDTGADGNAGSTSELVLAENRDNLFSMFFQYHGADNRLYLYGKDLNGVYGPHLSIQRNNGSVGIGISDPAARLDVNGTAGIRANNTLEFGLGVSGKEANAGKIGYQTFTAGALDIVGAGTNNTNRKIKFWNEGGATFAGEIVAPIVTVIGGSDVAEPYNVASAGNIKAIPGMLVSIDPDKVGQMRVASQAYDTAVAGIVSGANGINPGITLRQKGTIADGELPVASIGRVWCWCDADANGAIKAGDLLTSSDTPGHAMKATDRARRDGAVIGKAMSSLPSGKGLVLVLVSLK
jgi:hypothetical protein